MHKTHLSALEAKHAGLERQIMAESQRPLPDSQALSEMKKQKLKLKEEMAAI